MAENDTLKNHKIFSLGAPKILTLGAVKNDHGGFTLGAFGFTLGVAELTLDPPPPPPHRGDPS